MCIIWVNPVNFAEKQIYPHMAHPHKPKLLHINTVADSRNSVGGIMRSIVSHAITSGWDARMAVGRGDVSDVDYPIGGLLSVMAHVAASRLDDCEGWWSRRTTVKFLKLIDEWRPDIVHLHNVHGHYIHIPTLFEWLEAHDGMPIVMTLHDCWWLTGHCAFYNHLDCSPADGCVDCRHYKKEYPVSFVSKSMRNFRRKHGLLKSLQGRLNLVVPSQWTARRLDDAGLGCFPVKVIPHGIDIDSFASDSVNGGREIILAIAARWEKRKNLDAINRLAESGLCNAPIMVVGHLMGQTLHENIIYHPQIDSKDELVKLYSSAAVLVNPSISETFGLTALEAMAAGTPVIVNTDSALSEIVTPDSGVATDVNDTQRLADVINSILADSNRFSPQLASANYSSERMVVEYMNLYQSLICRGK